MTRHTGELPPALSVAAELLRDFPEPGEVFRARVLSAVRAAAPEPPRRRWSVHPYAAVAAALACVLLGAGGATLAHRAAAPAPDLQAPLPATAGDALPVRFSITAPGAQRVYLVGDFNRWHAGGLPLRRSADGTTWTVEVRLPPGRYEYSFMVDGRLARDPVAPVVAAGEFGEPNSVIMVGAGS